MIIADTHNLLRRSGASDGLSGVAGDKIGVTGGVDRATVDEARKITGGATLRNKLNTESAGGVKDGVSEPSSGERIGREFAGAAGSSGPEQKELAVASGGAQNAIRKSLAQNKSSMPVASRVTQIQQRVMALLDVLYRLLSQLGKLVTVGSGSNRAEELERIASALDHAVRLIQEALQPIKGGNRENSVGGAELENETANKGGDVGRAGSVKGTHGGKGIPGSLFKPPVGDSDNDKGVALRAAGGAVSYRPNSVVIRRNLAVPTAVAASINNSAAGTPSASSRSPVSQRGVGVAQVKATSVRGAVATTHGAGRPSALFTTMKGIASGQNTASTGEEVEAGVGSSSEKLAG